jgi:hypothetical protein
MKRVAVSVVAFVALGAVGHGAEDLTLVVGGSGRGTKVTTVAPPNCPEGSLSGQRPNWPNGIFSDADAYISHEYLAFENFPAGSGSLSEPICDLHWWGIYGSADGPCSESQDTFEIKFYRDDGNQPGDEVCGYRAVAERWEAGFTVEFYLVYEFSVDLPSCCPLASGWVSIQGYGGDADCWHGWIASVDGDSHFLLWDGSGMDPYGKDLSLCLTTKPDGDGDLIPDDLDNCPDTATGDLVDDDGCSTADDDADGVLNDYDDCPNAAGCGTIGADGCPIDSDADGVYDGCDDCPDTPSCATNIDAHGCAIDSDGDGSSDGCPPAAQDGGCCGAAGPVAPLGLAAGILLMNRFARYRSARRRL